MQQTTDVTAHIHARGPPLDVPDHKCVQHIKSCVHSFEIQNSRPCNKVHKPKEIRGRLCFLQEMIVVNIE